MVHVSVDPSIRTVVAILEGFIPFPEHKKSGETILELSERNNLSKIIIDTSAMNVMQQETQKWIEEVWFPRANRSGIRFMAFITPQNLFGKSSTTKVNQRSGNIEIAYFESMTKARAWISGK